MIQSKNVIGSRRIDHNFMHTILKNSDGERNKRGLYYLLDYACMITFASVCIFLSLTPFIMRYVCCGSVCSMFLC